MILYKIIRRIFRTVYREILKAYVRRRGVRIGSNVQLIGKPIVEMAAESTIRIGDGVVACSASHSTALGVSKPVILRTLAPGASISIGPDTGLSGTVICAAISVTIGANCLIGSDVTIADTNFHPIRPAAGRRHAPIPSPNPEDAVSIESDVFIGAGCHILKGVVIGHGSVIGARSVVVDDIPAMSIAVGNPARVVGTVTSA